MASTRRVRFLDAKFELTRRLSPDERVELAAVTLPVVEVAAGPLQLKAILNAHKAFAVGVLDGLAVHSIHIGEQSGIQLLGPGDVLIQPNADPPSWVDDVAFRAPAPMSVTLLGDDFLAAARRAPIPDPRALRLPGRPDAAFEQPARDLPASARRAASAGDAVAAGGDLGSCHARRGSPPDGAHARDPRWPDRRAPADRDAGAAQAQRGWVVLRQESGWLLLEVPPEPAGAPRVLAPELAGISLSRWAPEPELPADPSVRYAELKDTVRSAPRAARPRSAGDSRSS